MPQVVAMPRRFAVLLAAFVASGLAGLLYETLWGRYLGLLLGHAAWAQTMVLALYMGGMALGAAAVGRWRPRRLLRAFALTELAIGVSALLFHPAFRGVEGLTFDHLLPALGPRADGAVWLLSAALVLPSAVLLGATWPLLAAGALRRFPELGERALGWLYFGNTLGAAVGALSTSAFISALGLPGSLAAAGCLDIVVAAVVWRSAGDAAAEPPARPARSSVGAAPLLLAAGLTGLASFGYEIAWTRMLALVLGSSTRAFELMLGAFLLGLAIGGLLVRGHLGPRSGRLVAGVQVAMGVCAIASLPLYSWSFDAMAALLRAVEHTPRGWLLYNLGAEGIALGIMLPATVCAGTTMPLLTAQLIHDGHGEGAIGRAWSANTLGAIAGILLAVHVGLPVLGLKGLVCAAGAVDIAVGVGLALHVADRRRAGIYAGFGLGAVLAGLGLVQLDPYRMASGVYRTGEIMDAGSAEILFARDGRTATVSLTRVGATVAIRTNGKPDAGIRVDELPGADEHTMVLLGALPLALRPDARAAANVGMGSGLTTHVLLGAASLERVDTVEIEPVMIEGARLFGARVARGFEDPRSHLHIADAKAFFARQPRRYDILVSEPSNPWVSGVAGLFSREFYGRTRGWLAPGGLLVQWLQAYEIDLALLASVLGALSEHYADWEVYEANGGDLIVVASAEGPVPALDGWVLADPGLAPELARIDIRSLADLELRRLANRRVLEPLLAAEGAPANSDFAPILEQAAPRALFLGASAAELLSAELDALPMAEMLGGRAATARPTDPTWSSEVPRVGHRALGRALLRFHEGGAWAWPHPDQPLPGSVEGFAASARAALGCQPMPVGTWMDGLYNSVARRTLPHAGREEARALLARLRADDCVLQPIQRRFVDLLAAIVERDGAGMATAAEAILDPLRRADPGYRGWLLGAAMLGEIHRGQPAAARELWDRHAPALDDPTRAGLPLRILLAHAQERRFPL